MLAFLLEGVPLTSHWERLAGVLKIIPQGAVCAAPHGCLELHLVLYVHPESVQLSDTEFFLMGSKDYNSTSLTHFLVYRFGHSFKILTINQCSSRYFFYSCGPLF